MSLTLGRSTLSPAGDGSRLARWPSGGQNVRSRRAFGRELHIPESLTICVAPAETTGEDYRARNWATVEADGLGDHPVHIGPNSKCRMARASSRYRPHQTPFRGYPSVSCLIIDECAFLQGEGGGEDLIAGVLPMLTEKGQVYFSSTPAGKNNYFARLFLDAKPGDGVHRMSLRARTFRD